MSDEYCGESECGTCQRQDVDVFDDRVHIVNYHGKYVVHTMMAPELGNPIVALMVALAPEGDRMNDFPAYLTMVGFVGDEDASVGDSKLLVSDDEFTRFIQRHNDETKVREVHKMVFESVKSGLIDLETPITQEEANRESRTLGVEFGFLKPEDLDD